MTSAGEGADQMTAEDGVTDDRPQFGEQQAAVWSLVIDNGDQLDSCLGAAGPAPGDDS